MSEARSTALLTAQAEAAGLYQQLLQLPTVNTYGSPPVITDPLNLYGYPHDSLLQPELVLSTTQEDLELPREFSPYWWKEPEERKKIDHLFHLASDGVTHPNIMYFLVTQAVHGRSTFVDGVSRVFTQGAVISKPRNTDSAETLDWKKKGYAIYQFAREQTGDPEVIIPLIERRLNETGASGFVLLDIGGYFAQSNAAIQKNFGRRHIITIEDTVNGELAALNAGIDFPYGSIARDPDKSNFEDFLVGDRIALNAAMLHADIPQVTFVNVGGVARPFYRRGTINNVLVQGLGKVGTGAAETARNIFPNVMIYDTSEEITQQGIDRGFNMISQEEFETIRQDPDLDLIISCTGNAGMDYLKYLPSGVEVRLATGADDEMGKGNLNELHEKYIPVVVNQNTILYISREDPNNYFYSSEKAANFAMNPLGNGGKYSADIGPYILPSQAVWLRLAVRAVNAWESGKTLPTDDYGIARPTDADSRYVRDNFLRLWPECKDPYIKYAA